MEAFETLDSKYPVRNDKLESRVLAWAAWTTLYPQMEKVRGNMTPINDSLAYFLSPLFTIVLFIF